MNSCSNCKHRKWFKILSTCICDVDGRTCDFYQTCDEWELE